MVIEFDLINELNYLYGHWEVFIVEQFVFSHIEALVAQCLGCQRSA